MLCKICILVKTWNLEIDLGVGGKCEDGRIWQIHQGNPPPNVAGCGWVEIVDVVWNGPVD